MNAFKLVVTIASLLIPFIYAHPASSDQGVGTLTPSTLRHGQITWTGEIFPNEARYTLKGDDIQDVFRQILAINPKFELNHTEPSATPRSLTKRDVNIFYLASNK